MYYGSYYSSDYNLENKMNEIEKLFDEKLIDRMIQNSIYDFEEIRKCLDRCQKHISMLYYQKNIALNTNYKYEVCFYKRKYDKIYYYVELEKIPLMLNGFKYKSILSVEKFSGKERFHAIKRAHNLAKEYNCLLRDLVNKNKE